MQRVGEKLIRTLDSYSDAEKEILYLMFEFGTVRGSNIIFDRDLAGIAEKVYENTLYTEEMIVKTIKKYIYGTRFYQFFLGMPTNRTKVPSEYEERKTNE